MQRNMLMHNKWLNWKQLIICSCLSQDVHIPRLITPAEKGQDLEPRVIDAYIIQCQAEAQEGDVAPGFWTTAAIYLFC